MQMTREKLMYLATRLIVMAVYNVVVFVVPFNRGGGFWSGYGFTMLAMLLSAAVGIYVFGRGNLKSKFYGVPLISVTWRYLVAQLLVGFAQMGLDFVPIPFQYGIAVNAILLGACLFGLIVVNFAKEEIERIDEKVKEKVFHIKSMQVDVEGLVDKAPDEAAKKALKDLAETIRYSDPISSPQLAAIENKIDGKAAALAKAAESANGDATAALCNELQQLFSERNRKCKILK